ncbi:Methyltransferase-like protein 24 [Manis javanica]|nr:Methyltransferase-like protein 24 [Manis javanica]
MDKEKNSLKARCDDTQLEVSMAHHGHGVRRFDPSGKSLTLWGAPFLSPHIHGLEGPPSSYCCPRKLGTILNELGHHKDFVQPSTWLQAWHLCLGKLQGACGFGGRGTWSSFCAALHRAPTSAQAGATSASREQGRSRATGER